MTRLHSAERQYVLALLQIDIKSEAAPIRLAKSEVKDLQKNASPFAYIHQSELALRSNASRARFLAYGMLRGKTWGQIENNYPEGDPQFIYQLEKFVKKWAERYGFTCLWELLASLGKMTRPWRPLYLQQGGMTYGPPPKPIVVDDMEAALDHIAEYGSSHTEAIVTDDGERADTFVRAVQSSTVMVNASTRFADGGELGLGAEIGISTSKLHAFGPMGARELTTRKFVVIGEGQVRA